MPERPARPAGGGTPGLRPRWWKVLRDLWLHKARTALVIAAIVVGLVGAGTVLDTWALLRVVTRDGYLMTKPAAGTVRFDVVDSALLASIRALPSVRAATARQTVSARIRTPEGWRTAIVQAGDELAAAELAIIVREQGMWPPNDSAVIVERSSLEFARLAVGDTVMLQRGDGDPITLPVRGVARDGSLAPGWMEHVVYVYTTPRTLAALASSNASPASNASLAPTDAVIPTDVLFTVRGDPFDREHARRVARDVADAGSRAGRRVVSMTVPVPGEHMHAGQMNSLLYTQGAFGVLSLLLSGFLVVNLMTAMLTGQSREIGIMKAIGARPAQLVRMYLVLALLLGLVASLVAVPTAASLGVRYAAFAAELLNFDVHDARIPAWVLVLQAAAGLLLPVFAAAIPVWRGCRVSVNDALRDHAGAESDRAMHVASTLVTRPSRLIRALGVRRPLLLSLRNAFRRRERMAFTLVTLSLGGAVYLGALGLRGSIRDSVSVLYGEIMRFDLVLRFDDAQPAGELESMARSTVGVRDAGAWSSARAMLDRHDGMLDGAFPITALDPRSALIAFPVLEGAWLDDVVATDRLPQLVVNQRLRDQQPTLRLGDTVSLVIDGRSVLWRVRGLVESGPAPMAYTTPSMFASATRQRGARTLVVATEARTTAAQSDVLQRLRDRYESAGMHVANADLIQANRQSIEDHLLMVSGFLLAMSQLTILIGGLGLASTMSLAVLERTREIGIMRAIGASHGAIIGMVQVEALVIGGCSWVLAVPLSIPVSVLLARAFSRIMIPVPVHYIPDVGGMLLWLLVVVVVSAVSSAWPARRAVGVPTATALAYE
ncbi:MAG: ABC transporter permease [Gemmatimonadaceae bacterium]|jgi:putative ABC transport system permease protein|nr:ABC transporter permease [Gemmatimonadaceae bacterium]MCC6430810.1 ABC transporter permease [Gemmatimonadaceae bacterium]